MKANKHSGFTLIELMITVAIVGILAAVAYPAYTQYVIRSHRAAAQAEMMDISNRQQQFFLANRRYADTLDEMGYETPADVLARYTPTIDASNTTTPPNFLIRFAPKGVQVPDGDLTLNSDGVKTPADKWK